MQRHLEAVKTMEASQCSSTIVHFSHSPPSSPINCLANSNSSPAFVSSLLSPITILQAATKSISEKTSDGSSEQNYNPETPFLFTSTKFCPPALFSTINATLPALQLCSQDNDELPLNLSTGPSSLNEAAIFNVPSSTPPASPHNSIVTLNKNLGIVNDISIFNEENVDSVDDHSNLSDAAHKSLSFLLSPAKSIPTVNDDTEMEVVDDSNTSLSVHQSLQSYHRTQLSSAISLYLAGKYLTLTSEYYVGVRHIL